MDTPRTVTNWRGNRPKLDLPPGEPLRKCPHFIFARHVRRNSLLSCFHSFRRLNRQWVVSAQLRVFFDALLHPRCLEHLQRNALFLCNALRHIVGVEGEEVDPQPPQHFEVSSTSSLNLGVELEGRLGRDGRINGVVHCSHRIIIDLVDDIIIDDIIVIIIVLIVSQPLPSM